MESIGSDEWADRSMMEELHIDLISNVLIKLDVKTLSRCRCVCKTWNGVISSRGFMDAHRRQSISSGLSDILFIHFDDGKSSESDDGLWRFTIINPEEETNHTSIDMKSRTEAADDAEGGVDVNTKKMGTYNNTISINLRRMTLLDVTCDLLCLVDFGEYSAAKLCNCIKLCNPRTGQIRTLPKPPIDSLFWSDFVFGYVDSTRQYVLVGLFYKYYRDLTNYKTLKFCFSSNYECERHGDRICSCSITSSSWKEIEEACPLRLGGPGILVNNSVYWLEWLEWLELEYGQQEKGEIVSLELENEKYKIISCPQQFSEFTPTLIDLKGTLAVVLIHTSSLDIWVVDQFNNCSHSCGWGRKYSINMAKILVPENWWYEVYSKSSKNGELIMTVFSSGLEKHYVSNPEKGSFRAFIDPCSPSACLKMGFFWESLFSFGINGY